MDIEELQKKLRDFAAERDWQRYQTPKNLAMAMVVEAAELVEIFQWSTAEESMAIQQDAARHQHLSEEIADVLLYLVQIADHSGIDIAAAVERKLALNAVKYPVPSLSCGMQANLT
jgi:NTP pyrophosphatase (non-canonical NTP hydrolase)